jgi:uracil-DNA glycosylase
LVGQYGQKLYLGKQRKRTLTDTVQAWRNYGPDIIPTPHPSWRVSGWLKRNPWFEGEVVPEIQQRVQALRYAE